VVRAEGLLFRAGVFPCRHGGCLAARDAQFGGGIALAHHCPRDSGAASLDCSFAGFAENVFVHRQITGSLREATVIESSQGVLDIRAGDWKLIPHLGSGGFTRPATIRPTPGGPIGQLYNL